MPADTISEVGVGAEVHYSGNGSGIGVGIVVGLGYLQYTHSIASRWTYIPSLHLTLWRILGPVEAIHRVQEQQSCS